ncbi:RdRp [Plasmopara viticola lesion associated fusarivirus 2]|uniref:RdRp n=1 Tax=Plasmopara viticola lesion associated fusarivirus 2 TaxID=2692088 RepID=A0AAE6S642_9VIRU|nr:RdRp [Plasmopara viticola lesion associated fusarivirus 2]QHD64732.1 RdRp [Plasmopara viticola lesion associated fusarivirus 2]
MFKYVFKTILMISFALTVPVLLLTGTLVLGQCLVAFPSLWILGVWTPSSLLALLWAPFLGLWMMLMLRNFLIKEIKLIDEVGADKALWHLAKGRSWLLRKPYTGAIVEGWDTSGPVLLAASEALGLPDAWRALAEEGIMSSGSRLWSASILSFRWYTTLSVAGYFSLWLTYVAWLAWRFGARLLRVGFVCYVAVLLVLVNTPASTIWDVTLLVLQFASALQSRDIDGNWRLGTWALLRFKVAVSDLVIYTHALNTEVKRHYSTKLSGERHSAAVHFRRFTIRSVNFIDSMRLPEFARRRFTWKNTVDELQSSKDLMADLGWPVNVSITEPNLDSESSRTFKEWLICGSDFQTGIHTLQTHLDKNLDHLRSIAIVYKRTESYQSVDAETESTARYFKKTAPVGLPSVEDDVWHLIGTIFRNSQLTPYNYIIGKWVKKYALGFWMKTPGRNSKYNRAAFISTIGYARFKKLWAHTFYHASRILPVAHVSVKGEALPPKKWMAGKVRSIIGSPITQYIMSTVFNYGPNHNFDWESTPIKVGMPLNGYWISDLFSKHGRFNIHVEGDFTAFDSTIDGPVIDMIKAIRKRGFDYHKDRARIMDLVDISYDQVLGQALGQTSTGNVWRKGTGETTGHSATSMDNSMATVILYMAAWKELTGKSAREFSFFNELSCYGDDHLLSISEARPRAWTPRNIRKTMARWGVVNNLEVKSLKDCEFLSKRCMRANNTMARELRSTGVSWRPYVVWHDKAKLSGKLVAPVKNLNPTYQAKRLLSYLTLTAHHRDIYDGIVKIFESRAMQQALRESKQKIPSYESVMRAWYSPSEQPFIPDPDPELLLKNDGRLIQYGAPTLGDYMLGALSQLPDLLNPVVFNMGFSKAFQGQLAPLLVWIVDFIASTNGSPTPGLLRWAMRGTNYSWLDTDICVPGTSRSNFSSMLVRHWLFSLYCAKGPKYRGFALTDFVVRKVANLQFLLNGYVQRDFPRLDPSFDKVIVAALLGAFVHIPDWLSPLSGLHLPEPAVLLDYTWNWFLSTVWTNVPSNYAELNAFFSKGFGKHSPLLITAPTGTGKSTGLINHLATVAAVKFRKVIVVEPRALLAVGLRDYMKATFGLDCTAGTMGEEFKPEARVWYITPESLLAHFHLVDKTMLFVLDEAHIDENSYKLVKQLLSLLPVGMVWVTATPDESLTQQAKTVVDLPVASIWNVVERKVRLNTPEPVKGWLSRAVSIASNVGPTDRVAILVDTPEDAEYVAAQCNRYCQVLSSKSTRTVDVEAQVYVCTSVIDVGITLPDLHQIHFPYWEYSGKGERFDLSPLTYKQRRGRVGRTCNGDAYAYLPTHPFPVKVRTKGLDRAAWAGLVKSGVPASLVNHFDPEALASILGFDPDTVRHPEWKSIVRASTVFLNNMRPVFMANTLADRLAGPLGRPVALHATGAGNISSSWPQDNEKLFATTVRSTAAVIKQSLGMQTTEEEKTSLESLYSVAGPVLKIQNLAASLINDLWEGGTDMLNPKNREPSGSAAEVLEIPKILKLLKDVSQLADEVGD